MTYLLKALWKEEEGQDLIEYSLLVAFIALAATAGMNTLAAAVSTTFGTAATKLTTSST